MPLKSKERSLSNLSILIKGGGEMATGVAHRLFRSHFKVCITEIPWPTAVRRGVAFSEAIYEGEKEVEGVRTKLVEREEEIFKLWEEDKIPILIDPEAKLRKVIHPDILVDATMAKKNLGTNMSQAPWVIGLGPGFWAGKDTHLVVETNRSHNLGKVILEGEAEKNTGIPGTIAGFSLERVLRAPASGRFLSRKEIGDDIKSEEIVALVGDHPVEAKINGVLRGILRDGLEVRRGMKLGDIDPRGIKEYCFTISDKARAIAGGVLEGILLYFNKN